MKPKPWKGKNFARSGRLLILGESGYPWEDKSGAWHWPGQNHASVCARWMMSNKAWEDGAPRDGGRFLFQVTRALAHSDNPDRAARERAWHSCAFINYVRCTDVNRRPTWEQFEEARGPFLELLKKLRPHRVLVLGKTMWRAMPECAEGPYRRNGDLQTYKLADGSRAWALALHHPTFGRSWEVYAKEIEKFRKLKLPVR